MNNRISFDEKRQIQLQMLDEFDAFCRNHNLRYSLAYGTLIGAIRHQGFIPWDDDVDIIMPLPDFLLFKQDFSSHKIKICDVDSEDYYDFPFPRLAFRESYEQTGIITKEYGVSIDLYLLMGISDDDNTVKLFFTKANRILRRRLFLKQIRRKIIKVLPVKSIPFYSQTMREYKDLILNQAVDYSSAKRFYSISGLPDFSNVFNYDLFKDTTDALFEGRRLRVVSDYNRFLTDQYGNYMELPPEEERHPYHGGVFYWK